ncbi:glycosyltransferase family 4 protein [Pilimelia terevasa]|nr:glycosyltransferase family 4 protein [Pilimelia terevasa]
MLVDNAVAGDSRVQKVARSAAEAGWQVTLLGVSPTDTAQRYRLGGAEVRLLPMPGGGSPAAAGGGAGALRRRLVARGGLLLRLARAARRPVEYGMLWYWRRRLGDGAWRRLEPGLASYARVFGPVVDALEPDLIHAHDFRMLGVGAGAARRRRARGRPVALVWDAHEYLPGIRPRRDDARWLPAHVGYEREFAADADAVVTVSDELAGLLQTAHRLPERPVVVLNAPLLARPADAPDEPAPDLRRRCGNLAADTPLLVYSGVAAAQRGIASAVAALPHLPGAHLALVVGDVAAPYPGQVRALARRLGVADRVHLLPYVPYWQVVPLLAGADAGLIPIHHWPNHELALITKFFEYAHARLPVVVSDVRAMAAAVRATGQGEVFRAGDVDDLVRAVRAVLADPRRYRAAYDAPDSPLPRWTWPAQARRLDALYRRLVPAADRPAPTAGVPRR